MVKIKVKARKKIKIVDVDLDATAPQEDQEKVRTFPQYKDMNLLEGDDALLLAEGCKLNKKKKKAEKRLKEIRKELDLSKPGDYTNKAGDTLQISQTANKSEIEPKKLHSIFEKKKILSRFWGCVKVQITPLKKVMAETAIEKLRDDLDPTIKYKYGGE